MLVWLLDGAWVLVRAEGLGGGIGRQARLNMSLAQAAVLTCPG